jgi:2-isopropylmalate synthase
MPDLNVIDATAELKLLRFLDEYSPPFDVIGTYRLIDDGVRPEATVTLRAGKQEMHEADLGVGPVDALANVLKKSLGQLFPDIAKVRVLDFKVRLIEGHIGTSSQIEVDIVFSDGKSFWRVSSVDDNVNLASFRVLLDGYEYAIYLWDKEANSSGTRGKGKTKGQSPKPKAKTTAKPKATAKPKTKPKATAKPKPKSKPKSKS